MTNDNYLLSITTDANPDMALIPITLACQVLKNHYVEKMQGDYSCGNFEHMEPFMARRMQKEFQKNIVEGEIIVPPYKGGSFGLPSELGLIHVVGTVWGGIVLAYLCSWPLALGKVVITLHEKAVEGVTYELICLGETSSKTIEVYINLSTIEV